MISNKLSNLVDTNSTKQTTKNFQKPDQFLFLAVFMVASAVTLIMYQKMDHNQSDASVSITLMTTLSADHTDALKTVNARPSRALLLVAVAIQHMHTRYSWLRVQ